MTTEDRKMNAFAEVTDAEYVYGELADGSQVKMRKSDLFEGLFNNVFIDRISLRSYDDTSLRTGMYHDFDSAIDRNPILINYGIVLVFSYGETITLQIHVDTNNIMHFRIYANKAWYMWRKVSFT